MKNINELQEVSLGNIYQKAAQLKTIQQKIKAFLPEEFRAHCNVANFEKGVLVFALQSSAWAMRFRYIISELLSRLRKEGNFPQLASIEYYVEPDFLALFGKDIK